MKTLPLTGEESIAEVRLGGAVVGSVRGGIRGVGGRGRWP